MSGWVDEWARMHRVVGSVPRATQSYVLLILNAKR